MMIYETFEHAPVVLDGIGLCFEHINCNGGIFVMKPRQRMVSRTIKDDRLAADIVCRSFPIG